jgi:hypothetical protein
MGDVWFHEGKAYPFFEGFEEIEMSLWKLVREGRLSEEEYVAALIEECLKYEVLGGCDG